MFQFAQRSASKIKALHEELVDATRAARPCDEVLRRVDSTVADYSFLVFVIFDYRDLGLVVAKWSSRPSI